LFHYFSNLLLEAMDNNRALATQVTAALGTEALVTKALDNILVTEALDMVALVTVQLTVEMKDPTQGSAVPPLRLPRITMSPIGPQP
jgi:hypothetical protein